jgi:hypothetical protein
MKGFSMRRIAIHAIGIVTLVFTATSVIAQTSGEVVGTVDGHDLELPVTCIWHDDNTLGIKSHEFMMLTTSFEEEPALQMSFYNNSYFLTVLAGGKSYQMADQDAVGSLKPLEIFHHQGTVPQQTGHDAGYDFDLIITCPK